MKDLLSTSDVAGILGITRHHASLLLRTGTLKGQMIGSRWLTTKANVDAYKHRQEKRKGKGA